MHLGRHEVVGEIPELANKGVARRKRAPRPQFRHERFDPLRGQIAHERFDPLRGFRRTRGGTRSERRNAKGASLEDYSKVAGYSKVVGAPEPI